MQEDEPLHLRAVRLARQALTPNELATEPEPEVITVARRVPPPGVEPVALLAAFTTPSIHVLALWPGINRVGQRPPLSDYEEPAAKLFEARQWLIVVAHEAFAADDRTTNQSCYVAPEVPRQDAVVDPRYLAGSTIIGRMHGFPHGQRLDWHGTRLARLMTGGVLFSHYAGLAFAWLREPDRS